MWTRLVPLALLLSGCAAGGAAPPRAVGPDPARQVEKDGWVTFEVDSDEGRARIFERARALARDAGGFVASDRPGALALEIPAERLEPTVARLVALGEVVDRGLRAEDVTAAYADLEIRIDNARRLQARLRVLVGRADRIEEILAVEEQLARVTTELERLEAERRRRNQEVRYASLEVSAEDAVRPGPIGWVFYGAYRAVRWLFVWD